MGIAWEGRKTEAAQAVVRGFCFESDFVCQGNFKMLGTKNKDLPPKCPLTGLFVDYPTRTNLPIRHSQVVTRRHHLLMVLRETAGFSPRRSRKNAGLSTEGKEVPGVLPSCKPPPTSRGARMYHHHHPQPQPRPPRRALSLRTQSHSPNFSLFSYSAPFSGQLTDHLRAWEDARSRSEGGKGPKEGPEELQG